jgi:hypothetical protein
MFHDATGKSFRQLERQRAPELATVTTGGRRQQARQGKATGMETAPPPVNEQRATGLSLNNGTGEGKARRRTGSQLTGTTERGPNTAVLSWSAQPTESRDLVRDHRQSIPISNANQSGPVTLQVRDLLKLSHDVIDLHHTCDPPQQEYLLRQITAYRQIREKESMLADLQRNLCWLADSSPGKFAELFPKAAQSNGREEVSTILCVDVQQDRQSPGDESDDSPDDSPGDEQNIRFQNLFFSDGDQQVSDVSAEAGDQPDTVLIAEAGDCSGKDVSGSVVGFDPIPGDESDDSGGSYSDFDSDSDFDLEAEQMREHEAAYSAMQLQADLDQQLQQNTDLFGSDLSGDSDVSVQPLCSNSDEELDELDDCDQQLHEEDGSDQQVSGDEEGSSGGFDSSGSDSAGDQFSDRSAYSEEELFSDDGSFSDNEQ